MCPSDRTNPYPARYLGVMRKTSLLAFILALSAGAAGAQSDDKAREQRFRAGERPGLTALVPADWKLEPLDPNWKGARFTSPDGQSWLAFYATPADRDSLELHLREIISVKGDDITYLQRKRNWVVVSGFRGDHIFYRRVTLACGGRSWRHIAFEYPAQQKLAFDGLVTRVSHALASVDERDCNAVARE
jgi:hypothetical protein